jgi:hypothetical protein
MQVQSRELAELLFAGMPGEHFDCFVAGLGEILARLRYQGLSHEIHEDDQ